MITFKGCQRCGGDIVRDDDGPVCLQCGGRPMSPRERQATESIRTYDEEAQAGLHAGQQGKRKGDWRRRRYPKTNGVHL